jgi:predicted nucleic acid-binding Zn ribbon protein
MSAAPLEQCLKEQCPKARWGKGPVRRGIGGGSGLIFKGSGFYITDYRSEGYKSAAKADGTAPISKPSTESKPAATPEAKPTPKPVKPKS